MNFSLLTSVFTLKSIFVCLVEEASVGVTATQLKWWHVRMSVIIVKELHVSLFSRRYASA